MHFEATPIAGAFLIRLDARTDERGFFARTFCVDEFRAAGLESEFVQQSLARSVKRGTLRGMHLQIEPDGEAKYVRCTSGAVYDAIVDVRPSSPTFRRSYAVRLDAAAGDALYVPRGCAHGYQTLVDHTDVLYAMSSRYAPGAARSIRYDDPALRIAWPLDSPILSRVDREAPSLEQFLAAEAEAPAP